MVITNTQSVKEIVNSYKRYPDRRLAIYDEMKRCGIENFLPHVAKTFIDSMATRQDTGWVDQLMEKIIQDMKSSEGTERAVSYLCRVVASHYETVAKQNNAEPITDIIVVFAEDFRKFPYLLIRAIKLSREGCLRFAKAHLADTRIYYVLVAIEIICLLDQFRAEDSEIIEISSSHDTAFLMLLTLLRLSTFSENSDRGRELRRIAIDLARYSEARQATFELWRKDLTPRKGESDKLKRARLRRLREFYLQLLQYEDAALALDPMLSGEFPELIPDFVARLEDEITCKYSVDLLSEYKDADENVAVERLLAVLNNPKLGDENFQLRNAAQALIQIGEPAAQKLICFGIANPSRRELIQKIFQQMEAYPMDAFFAAFNGSPKEEDRLALVELFCITKNNIRGLVESFSKPGLGDAAAFFLAWQDDAQETLILILEDTESRRAATLALLLIGGDALTKLSNSVYGQQWEETFYFQTMSVDMLANCLNHPSFSQLYQSFLQAQLLLNLEQLTMLVDQLDKSEAGCASNHWFVRYVVEHPNGAIDQALVRRFSEGKSLWLADLLVKIGRRTLQHLALLFRIESKVEAQARQIAREIALTETEKYPWVISILSGRPDEPEAIPTLRLLAAAKFPRRLETFGWVLRTSHTSLPKQLAIEGITKLNCPVQQSVFEDVMSAALDEDAHLNVAATRLLISLGEKFNMKADEAANHRVKERIKEARQSPDHLKRLNVALTAIS